MGPFVGQNWGAQQVTRVRLALVQGYRFCLTWGVAMAVVLAFSGRFLATLFNPDAAVVAIATRYLWIVPISYGAMGLLQVTNSAFNGMGKPLPSITLTALHMVGCYIPLAYVGNRFIGPMGIFAAAAIANLIAGAVAYRWSQRLCLQSPHGTSRPAKEPTPK